jgi:C-terminal processing protease CtpA/Prc
MECSEAMRLREALCQAGFVALVALAACGSSTGSVGAMLGKDVHTGRLFVREVPPGMAAAIAGLREGDEIVAIEGEPVADLSPKQVHEKLQGKIGSTVTLLVVREGVTRKVAVTRGPFDTREATSP